MLYPAELRALGAKDVAQVRTSAQSFSQNGVRPGRRRPAGPQPRLLQTQEHVRIHIGQTFPFNP